MKRANPININTQELWNEIYKDRKKYISEQTGETARFTHTLEEIKAGDNFLDIGCGVGMMTRLVKDRYPMNTVYGVDISDKVIEDNKKSKAHYGINYFTGVVGAIDKLTPNYFDVIFSGETLEHLDNPAVLFQDAQKLLKPGGKFILTTPQGNAIETPEHTWYFDQQDIEELYLNNGFDKINFVYLPDSEHLMVIYAVGYKK